MSRPIPQPEIQTAAIWQPPESIEASERPEHWRWLTENGSLTGYLEQTLALSLDVDRLSEVEDGDGALRREVRLYAGGVPLVYAVSHIPAELLRRLDWVRSLGDQPLGTRLFADPEASRDELRVAYLDSDDPLVQRATEGLDQRPSPLWARRSRLLLQGQAMVIVECFLREDAR